MKEIDKILFESQITKGLTILELSKYWECSTTTISRYKRKWHLTKNPLINKVVDGLKKCNFCLIEKPVSEFQKAGSKIGGAIKYKATCKSCLPKKMYTRLHDILKKSNREYKCESCGYDKNYGALQFHHLDPLEKEYEIGGMKEMAIEKIELEINKCAVLCANCHTEYHNPHLNN